MRPHVPRVLVCNYQDLYSYDRLSGAAPGDRSTTTYHIEVAEALWRRTGPGCGALH